VLLGDRIISFTGTANSIASQAAPLLAPSCSPQGANAFSTLLRPLSPPAACALKRIAVWTWQVELPRIVRVPTLMQTHQLNRQETADDLLASVQALINTQTVVLQRTVTIRLLRVARKSPTLSFPQPLLPPSVLLSSSQHQTLSAFSGDAFIRPCAHRLVVGRSLSQEMEDLPLSPRPGGDGRLASTPRSGPPS